MLMSYMAEDWIAGVGLILLAAAWHLLTDAGRPPVLPLAFTFQWSQVTCGIYYYALTGRQMPAMYDSDYRPMVLAGLGCLFALLVGLVIGRRLAPSHWTRSDAGPGFAFSWQTLLVGYVVSLAMYGTLRELAWTVPVLAQGIIAVSFVRLAMLFLMLRRVVFPRFRARWFFGLMVLEVGLGFTGYFAGFREPFMLAALVFIESFDRKSAVHWMRLAGLTAAMTVAGVLWMGVRTTYRSEFAADAGFSDSRTARARRITQLSSEWFRLETAQMLENVDGLVDRIWAIYYPALAMSRVPSVLPHEDGAIMWSAVRHIVTPRILFPDKAVLPSDSEKVRKYTGVYVASTDENTSIAFGYAAEAYVDFGIPLMFLPSLLFGVAMGVAYRFFFHLLYHRELAIGLVCVVFWLALYLFERSWIKTLGTTGTLFIYLGGITYLADRYLLQRQRSRTYYSAGAAARARAS